jgi:hypothetical protein
MLESAAMSSVAADLASTADSLATAGSVAITIRPCPDCEAEMGRALVFGIEVDACAQHGTWFDRTELATLIARVLPDPGEVDVEVPEGMVSHLALLNRFGR